MIKYPKIGQFRNAVHAVNHRVSYEGEDDLGNPIYGTEKYLKPTLHYVGTVKLHGTNASVRLQDGEIFVQSRNGVVDSGHYGFYDFVKEQSTVLQSMLAAYASAGPTTIYGEWCGGNVQGGVGITGLDKMFVIFSVLSGEDSNDIGPFTLSNPERGIYNINDFAKFEIDIDFNEPNKSATLMTELVNAVEAECPVARKFGVENGCGEGIVWKCTTPGYTSPNFWFKTKGAKHSVTKVKVLVAKDPEVVANIKEFVEIVSTEERLSGVYQGFNNPSRKDTGKFVNAFKADVLAEESDTLEANGLTIKDVSGGLATAARLWFFNELDSNL